MSDSCIVKIEPKDPLTKERFGEVCNLLKSKLRERCQQAYLFGSAAKGSFSVHSDIDLLIVKDTTVPFTKRSIEFEDLFDIFVRLDILVYTPSEFSTKMSSGTFPKDISQNLVRIL